MKKPGKCEGCRGSRRKADPNEHRRASEYEAQNLISSCAESYADADLPRPLRHPIRHHAVNSDRAEAQGHESEAAEQDHRELARGQPRCQVMVHRADLGNRLLTVGAGDGVAQGRSQRERVSDGGANNQVVSQLRRAPLRERRVHGRDRSHVKPVLLHIADDAHHRQPARIRRLGARQFLGIAEPDAPIGFCFGQLRRANS